MPVMGYDARIPMEEAIRTWLYENYRLYPKTLGKTGWYSNLHPNLQQLVYLALYLMKFRHWPKCRSLGDREGRDKWRIWLHAMKCKCTAFFLVHINIGSYAAKRKIPSPKPAKTCHFEPAIPLSQAQASQSSIKVNDTGLGALNCWGELDSELSNADDEIVSFSGKPAYHTEASFKDWTNSKTVQDSRQGASAWRYDTSQTTIQRYNSAGTKPLVDKSLRIARGFILRAKADSMAMFVTIGLNTTAQIEGFISHNRITSAQDFGATIRAAGCDLIARFGLDGRRLSLS